MNATQTVQEEVAITAKQCIEVAKRLLDTEKAIFARQAGENPSLAIKYAETVLGRQYVYEAWQQVGTFIDVYYGGETARTAVTICLESLKQDLSSSIDKVTFPSVLEHAQHGCYQRALKYVIQQLEDLLKVCN